jgi:hypothetical protein
MLNSDKTCPKLMPGFAWLLMPALIPLMSAHGLIYSNPQDGDVVKFIVWICATAIMIYVYIWDASRIRAAEADGPKYLNLSIVDPVSVCGFVVLIITYICYMGAMAMVVCFF